MCEETLLQNIPLPFSVSAYRECSQAQGNLFWLFSLPYDASLSLSEAIIWVFWTNSSKKADETRGLYLVNRAELESFQGPSYILLQCKQEVDLACCGPARQDQWPGSKCGRGNGCNLETQIQCLTFTLLLAESHSHYYFHATSPGPRHQQQPPPGYSPFFHERCPRGHH